MNSAVPAPAHSGNPPRPPQRPDGGLVLTVVNGVLAGVGGVYASTHSVLVTAIAAVTAVMLAAIVLVVRR